MLQAVTQQLLMSASGMMCRALLMFPALLFCPCHEGGCDPGLYPQGALYPSVTVGLH